MYLSGQMYFVRGTPKYYVEMWRRSLFLSGRKFSLEVVVGDGIINLATTPCLLMMPKFEMGKWAKHHAGPEVQFRFGGERDF